jgi:putative Ca2+/H+ antiporter (TMEM165/GDT1 family)
MIDWKVFAATFGTVFLAELGDKTQIATFGAAAARQSAPWSVFLGSAAALVACSAIAVAAGTALGRVIPVVWLERVGATLLVGLGLWMLVRSFAGTAQ